MEYLVFVLVIFAFIIIIMLKGLWDENTRKVKFACWLHEHYGELPKREEYRPEDFERISHYYKAHQNDFSIDDITWNDLNMDNIFCQMNYTYSAAGEEYLYHMLRTPMQNNSEMEQLEKQIQFFMENEEERVKYQTYFASLGKTGKYSIYDYLNYLDTLGVRNNTMHYLGDLLIAGSLLFMFLSTSLGVVLLIASMIFNITSYFRYKKDIEPYITSFAYILRLLKSSAEIEKIHVDVFADELKVLSGERKKLGKFKAGSYILMSGERMNASSNPLEIVMDYLRMTFHLDLIKFNNMLSEVRQNIESIDMQLTISGYMEAVIAIGAYRTARKSYCVPDLTCMDSLSIENMYHPLIANPVKNSISAEKGVLLTGSNASGKSTFLKTVALNAILAQTIHTCTADSYKGGIYRIFSSMSLRDDLSGGDSYFIVEIKSLKRILNATTEEGNKVLCFVDEVLRGTNTVERIAASTQILKSLAFRNLSSQGFASANTICFAATHDIELTHLLEKDYDNYHFEEEIIDGDVVFNYKLMDGRATTRNAIKLLSVIGYDETIIKEAEDLAESFLKSGKWEANSDI